MPFRDDHPGIILIGYRGAGKTTVGRLLASTLDMGFVDTDEFVVSMTGKSIRRIFEEDGESGFRDAETLAIDRAVSVPDRVISVGGGAVERPKNRANLRAYGTVFWLDAAAEELWARMCADPATEDNRPHLAGGGLTEVQAVMARREPIYRASCHVRITVTGVSPDGIVADIRARLSQAGS